MQPHLQGHIRSRDQSSFEPPAGRDQAASEPTTGRTRGCARLHLACFVQAEPRSLSRSVAETRAEPSHNLFWTFPEFRGTRTGLSTVLNVDHKFSSHAEKCVLVGYSNQDKGYKLWHKATPGRARSAPKGPREGLSHAAPREQRWEPCSRTYRATSGAATSLRSSHLQAVTRPHLSLPQAAPGAVLGCIWAALSKLSLGHAGPCKERAKGAARGAVTCRTKGAALGTMQPHLQGHIRSRDQSSFEPPAGRDQAASEPTIGRTRGCARLHLGCFVQAEPRSLSRSVAETRAEPSHNLFWTFPEFRGTRTGLR
ncbi:hypothetical protein E3N88_40246 [Mikania micrantha]|uniref:Retroviral polymerase SH3-like domain-containing protein n=1 Tax=Mikania micrantha TaxID=192012 RepID=A0A5N6LM60_9ASTR|nr:hypothetical protein E3N88_40246 [Mikania micrantha]